MQIECSTLADTLSVGRKLASLLRPGDVVVLAGQLGAGKTAFAGGVAEGLGIDEPIASPTFVLMRRYDGGFMPMIHADVYRLGSLGEFEDLDVFEEARTGVLLIEWGDAVAGRLPADHLTVTLTTQDETSRLLELAPSGSWNARPLQELSL